MNIAKRVEKAVLVVSQLPRCRPNKAQHRKPKVLERDEPWTFAGQRKRTVWR